MEPLKVSTFIINFTSVFTNQIHDLISKLEVADNQRCECIIKWVDDAEKLTKYCLSILKSCRNSNSLMNRFDVLFLSYIRPFLT